MAGMMETLKKLFLFQSIDASTFAELLARVSIRREVYRRGDVLCEPTNYRRALYVLLRGECDVLQHQVTLNTLRAGDSFGVASLFSQEEEYPSTVVARKETEVAVISREAVEELMTACPQIALNVIVFLTGRVEYLNRRVAALTEPTVERKLAGWLLQAADGTGTVTINRKRTAEVLHCGRASLYRALDTLKGKGLIACEGNQIHLVSPKGLERLLL